MLTHVPGFQSFFKGFLHNFVLAKLATSSIHVNPLSLNDAITRNMSAAALPQ